MRFEKYFNTETQISPLKKRFRKFGVAASFLLALASSPQESFAGDPEKENDNFAKIEYSTDKVKESYPILLEKILEKDLVSQEDTLNKEMILLVQNDTTVIKVRLTPEGDLEHILISTDNGRNVFIDKDANGSLDRHVMSTIETPVTLNSVVNEGNINSSNPFQEKIENYPEDFIKIIEEDEPAEVRLDFSFDEESEKFSFKTTTVNKNPGDTKGLKEKVYPEKPNNAVVFESQESYHYLIELIKHSEEFNQ